jgi:DNA-binding NtrC family response regulator
MNFSSSINTGNEGLFWLKEIRKLKPDTSVIMITAYGDIDLAVRSLKEGAADFVIKPWHNEKLIATIKETLKRKGGKPWSYPSHAESMIGKELLGESEPMQQIFVKIEKIAPTDANILILGEKRYRQGPYCQIYSSTIPSFIVSIYKSGPGGIDRNII